MMRKMSMKRKAGKACILLGAALVLSALFLFLYNQREGRQAEIVAESVLPEIIGQIEIRRDEGDVPDPYNPAMTEVKIGEYTYVGYLSIPVLGLELPVMAEWDYDRLRVAPCRYFGSTKTDNLIIAGHNYAAHFGQLSSLKAGDAIYFTDMDGMVWNYEAAVIETLSATDVEGMTDSGYALTLFTCTYGGQSRVTVRCERVTPG